MVFEAINAGIYAKKISPEIPDKAAEIQDTTWGQQTMRDNHMRIT